jgi:hypothetical protein
VSCPPTVESTNATAGVRSTGRSAFLVGAGILLSRILGLIRLRVFSYYFGLQSEAAGGEIVNRASKLLFSGIK